VKAVIMKNVKEISVEEVDVKKPVNDEVLVKIDVAGLCGTDIHMWDGTNFEGTFPFIPGHEWVGHVIEVGENVKDIKVGGRVMGDNYIGCGVCNVCRNGAGPHFCPNKQAYGYTPEAPGGMAEYHWSPEERIYRIPDEIDDDTAVLAETVSVPYNAIYNRLGGLAPHDRIAIIGVGPIGLLSLAISSISGSQVIVLEPSPERRKIAKEMYGAKHVIDPSKEDPVKRVMELTNGLGVTKIVECSGSISGIALTVDIIAVDGKIALTGHSLGTKVPIELGKIIWTQATILGSCGAPYFMQKTIDFLSRGIVDFKKIITHRFPIEDALEAFKLGLGGKAGKILIYPDSSKIPT